MLKLCFGVWCIVFLFSQGKLSGSVSVEGSYREFDENSKIWGKSDYVDFIKGSDLDPLIYDYEKYSVSSKILGLQEKLSLSLFYFTPDLKVALFSRVTNSDWVQPTELRYIDRVTLNVNIGQQKIIIGDHYLDGNENFIKYRKIRGITGEFNIFPKLPDSKVLVNVFSGISEYAYRRGDPIPFRYKSYYKTNHFQRNISGGEIKSSWFNKVLNINVNFLTGKDKTEGHIGRALTTTPLENTVYGVTARINLMGDQFHLYGHYYNSKKDSLLETSNHKGKGKNSILLGLGLENEQLILNVSGYRIDSDYFTLGHPFLITNREGIKFFGQLRFSDKVRLLGRADFYNTNLNKSIKHISLFSKRMSAKLNVALSSKLNFLTSFYRFSDKNKSSAVSYTSIFRVTNGYNLDLNYSISKGGISASFGYNRADDNSNYGVVKTDDGQEKIIRGVNFHRIYYKLSGYYAFNQHFNINASITTNDIAQENIDKTNIMSIHADVRYKLISNKLNLDFSTHLILSDNALEEYDFFASLEDILQSRYRLYSAINKYNYNFFELGAEYLFNYSLKVNFVVRLEKKKYNYLGNLYQTNADIVSAMLRLNDPNFFNQRESFNATLFSIRLSYLL